MPDRDMERRDELLEKGWQQMSTILDREMPQRRQRRRFVFWIPIGMIGALALGYSLFAVGNSTTDRKVNESINTEHVMPPAKQEEAVVKREAEVTAAVSRKTSPAQNDRISEVNGAELEDKTVEKYYRVVVFLFSWRRI